VPHSDHEHAKKLMASFDHDIQGMDFDEHVCKVSVVGVGMKSHSGVAATAFTVLAKSNINIQMISTSEIKISMVIDDKYGELAIRTLHEAYGLDK
ncbi:MAG: ACT domain-containing protein, partial [Sulfurovum sp.]